MVHGEFFEEHCVFPKGKSLCHFEHSHRHKTSYYKMSLTHFSHGRPVVLSEISIDSMKRGKKIAFQLNLIASTRSYFKKGPGKWRSYKYGERDWHMFKSYVSKVWLSMKFHFMRRCPWERRNEMPGTCLSDGRPSLETNSRPTGLPSVQPGYPLIRLWAGMARADSWWFVEGQQQVRLTSWIF